MDCVLGLSVLQGFRSVTVALEINEMHSGEGKCEKQIHVLITVRLEG